VSTPVLAERRMPDAAATAAPAAPAVSTTAASP
jgi:hypothetical protein